MLSKLRIIPDDWKMEWSLWSSCCWSSWFWSKGSSQFVAGSELSSCCGCPSFRKNYYYYYCRCTVTIPNCTVASFPASSCIRLKALRPDWLTESFSKKCWCRACRSNGIIAGEPAFRKLFKPHCARTCSFPCAFFCWSLFQILFAVMTIELPAAKMTKIINPEDSWLNLPTSTVPKWCYYNATDTTVLTITV